MENSIEEMEEKLNKNLDFLIETANEIEQLTAVNIVAMKQPTLLLFLSILSEYKRVLKENEELKAKWDKDTHILQNELDLTNADKINNYIPVQKVKDIIDRIDYDIKKTKEIISKNTNIYACYRKNDYQIVRLRAMNTKSLDIKKRLQELLESEE